MPKRYVSAVQKALGDGAASPQAAALADEMLAELGEEALSKGVHQVEATTVLWALRVGGQAAPAIAMRIYDQDGSTWPVWKAPHPEPRPDALSDAPGLPMRRLGDSDLYVLIRELPNFSATAFRYEAEGKRFGDGWVVLERFQAEPECRPQPGVPQGTLTEHVLKQSSVFPGTARGYWLYVPAQYQPSQPACLMVFQDGGMYLQRPAPVPTVLDNLIYKGELPPIVGLFVNPGTFDDKLGRFQNRSVEYDTLSDQYARFLEQEMIQAVSEKVNLRQDAGGRAICGISSGAVCAFTAAWERPDLFSKVLCHVGSFTGIRGAYEYPYQIRKTARKPIRIYLQDGSNDIDDMRGNWPLANQQMATAMVFQGYDYRFDFGRGFHSLAHGGATLPSSLRWLWREEAT